MRDDSPLQISALHSSTLNVTTTSQRRNTRGDSILLFKHKKAEEAYRKTSTSDIRKAKTFLISFAVYIVAITAKETIDMGIDKSFTKKWDIYLYNGIGFICFLVGFGLFFKLLKKFPRLRNYRDWFISGFGCGAIIAYYLVFPRTNYKLTSYGFWIAYNHQSFVCIILLVMKTWYLKILFLVFSTIFVFARKYGGTDDLKYLIEIIFFLGLASLFIFQQERTNRTDFQQNYETSQFEKNWESLIGNLPEGVLLVNKKREIVYNNPSFHKMLSGAKCQTPSISVSKSWEYLRNVKELKIREEPLRTRDNEYQTSHYTFNAQHARRKRSSSPSPTLQKKSSLQSSLSLSSDHKRNSSITNLSLITMLKECKNVDELIRFMLDNLEELKSHPIFHVPNDEELKFIAFDAKYESQNIEVKVAFTSADFVTSIVLLLSDTTYVTTISTLKNNDSYKSMVLASVSHELRTPLNGSMSMLQAVIDDNKVPNSVRSMFVKPAINSLKMLLTLVNDILDYSQINANKFRMTFQAVNLKQLILDACSIVELQVKKKGLEIQLEYDNTIPSKFKTDPNRLTQILLNLLSNAIKFTQKGEIKVICKTENDDNSIVHISIKDSGIGMKPVDISKLFDNYTKIELGENAHMNSTGCGLGLNIANKLAMSLGRGEQDHMQVKSEVNKGSTFTFVIENKEEKADERFNVLTLNTQAAMLETKDDALNASITEYAAATSERVQNKDDMVIATQPKGKHSLIQDTTPPTSATKVTLNPDVALKICSCPDILIVDDDAMNVYSLESMVESLGFTFESAFNGQDACENFEKRLRSPCNEYCHGYRFVFLDYEMPLLNGPETAKRIRELSGDQQLYIIGCTGHEEEEKIQTCINAGMNQVITKPIKKLDLKDLLYKYS